MSAYVLPGHPTKASAGYDCNCGACLLQRQMRKQLTPLEQMVHDINEGETIFIRKELLCQLHGYFDPSTALVISMQSDGWLVRLMGAPQR